MWDFGPRSGNSTREAQTRIAPGAGRPAFVPLSERVEPGQMIGMPRRSGGAFDPFGPRRRDVQRADDLVELFEGPGRKCFLTLTVNRRHWSSPAAAYADCNPRVCEVMRPLGLPVSATAFEVQGRTGAGWPHWHVLFRVPSGMSLQQIRRSVVRFWSFRASVVDESTGEVSACRRSCGFSSVEISRSNEGSSRYLAKYCVKPWAAVPPWMGESFQQLRKIRFSRAAFSELERIGRHVVQRGARRVVLEPACGRRRRRVRRRMYDRLASSGCSLAVYRVDVDRRLRYVVDVPVPATAEGAEWLLSRGASALQCGPFISMRWVLPHDVVSDAKRGALAPLSRRQRWFNRCRVASAWDEAQARPG